MKKTIVLFVLAMAVVSCGDDDAGDGSATTVDETRAESNVTGSTIATPADFPVVFPEGGDVITVDDPDSTSAIESVVVAYPDGDFDELAEAIRIQMPPDTNETSGQGQISMNSAQIIVNVSQQPDIVYVSVSVL